MNFTQFPTEIVRNIASYLVEVRYYKGKYCGQVSKEKQAILENTLIKHPIIHKDSQYFDNAYVELLNNDRFSDNYYLIHYVYFKSSEPCMCMFRVSKLKREFCIFSSNTEGSWELNMKTNKWQFAQMGGKIKI